MSDIIDINVAQTVEEVTINVTEEVIQVNINTINGGGGIESVVAGSNITVDNTDPQNPIINANADAVTSVNSDIGDVIVDLPSVLAQGNRTIYEADATYTTQTIDKGRFIFVINGSVSINVDDAEHSVGDELDIYNERTNGLQITLLGSAIFPDSTNVALVPPSGRILLKKIDPNFWYYSIINNSRILYLENILGSGFGSIMQVADTFEFVNGSNNLIYSLEPAFLNIYKTAGIGGKLSMFNLTDYRQFEFPDEDGTVALISDIPSPITIDTTIINGSTNPPDGNAVFDALATKVSKSDYTPAHSILVQQSGTGTPTALSVGNNTLVGRLSGGGSDIDDLSVSDVRTLLSINNVDNTSDLNKPISTATQTALDLKQDKSKSETFVLSKANGTFGSHTGTTAETVLFSADISAGEFTAGDFMKVMLDITKVGTAGTANVRLRAGTAGTTSDALIGTLFLLSGTLDAGFIRERFQFLSGNLLSGIQNNYTSNQTDIVINSVVKQSTSLTPSNAWKITVSVALANSADTVSCLGYRVSKIKTI
jgi:hypothetical protein